MLTGSCNCKGVTLPSKMAVKAYQPVTARSVANNQATTGPLGMATLRALKLQATCVGSPPLKRPSGGSARGVDVSYFGKRMPRRA